ncbi:SDR family NAD(P)-dependent oxidoreductase [Limibaculum sp. M0105]|uniref:SDR family NAD(P)-dependent oxidoreductase n=1 Tax=Thermohalobaculum xanthum TaxID=2753746 RepID=A0A8J7M866_9RHOB|nr:SDR family NAD(P)-dependent oxidoreductase [Thermohalobaculum xanthum]MBK0399985.1 SDR family NAD(P)-dependent oxidoreductase [Thermohalobaculum xanthum]
MSGKWRAIVLTGASGGIGRELAIAFAAPGVTMLLVGRDRARLDGAALAARERGAKVETAVLDVTDAEALAGRLAAFDAAHAVDLVVANAGVSAGRAPGGAIEPPGTMRRLVEINLMGAVNTVEPLIPAMVARGAGRIALVSSLAGLRPLPDMPAYSATKAALRAWGTSLRGALAPRGVGVSVISPGFVTTPMAQRHRGPKPFEMDAARAARIISRGLERGRPLITFPLPLAAMVWLGNRLPPVLSDLAIRAFGAEILPEGDEGDDGGRDGL